MNPKNTIRAALIAALCTGLLAGCSTFGGKDEPPLPGERVSILQLQSKLEPDTSIKTAPFTAPESWRNEFWPQAGGYPNHAMQHLALGNNKLERAWSADIGEGTTRELPLTAQPIVVDGRIFTLDTQSHLTAFSVENGKRLWAVDVSNPHEDDEVIGGGVAYSHGQLYVTTGYNEVIALDPADGSLIWRVPIPSIARAAPTVIDDRVFVSTLDNKLFALNAADGSVIWDYAGISETAGLVGAASPAANREIVLPAFSSGELFALRVENGLMAWSENLSALQAVGNVERLSDIRGLPVIDKGLVVAISFGGRMAAIDERTGNRVWQREIGGSETPWIAGNRIFVLSNDGELVSLVRETGAINWVADLPRYEDEDDRSGAIYWAGPVFAGGRLIIAGTNGEVIEISPSDGSVVRRWSHGRAVTIAPVVAGDTLYILSEDGTLTAYR